MVARNLRAHPGEIDLLVRFGHRLVVVEVKTRWRADPALAFTPEKAERVWRSALRLRPTPHRVDLVTVRVGPAGIEVRWLPGGAG